MSPHTFYLIFCALVTSVIASQSYLDADMFLLSVLLFFYIFIRTSSSYLRGKRKRKKEARKQINYGKSGVCAWFPRDHRLTCCVSFFLNCVYFRFSTSPGRSSNTPISAFVLLNARQLQHSGIYLASWINRTVCGIGNKMIKASAAANLYQLYTYIAHFLMLPSSAVGMAPLLWLFRKLACFANLQNGRGSQPGRGIGNCNLKESLTLRLQFLLFFFERFPSKLCCTDKLLPVHVLVQKPAITGVLSRFALQQVFHCVAVCCCCSGCSHSALHWHSHTLELIPTCWLDSWAQLITMWPASIPERQNVWLW